MKKGFTLIELLAILAILAIIALVTTPIVLNIINDVRKDSFEQTADSIVTAVRNLQNNDETFGVEKEVDFSTEGNKTNIEELKLDGSYDNLFGKVGINKNGKIALAVWDNDLEMCAYKSTSAKEVTIVDNEVESITQDNCIKKYVLE